MKSKKNLSSLISHLSSPSGFTLIELLIVIAIVGILASSLFLLINPATQFKKSRDVQRKNDLSLIKKSLELYYSDNNSYPIQASIASGAIIPDAPWGGTWTGYMTKVPKDPVSGQVYTYESTDGTYFKLFTKLENLSDSQIISGANSFYNFCISSPNVSTCTPVP
ncbi:MAG: prepilin-type N-terminal cleavage/methylation domain-containing protein [Patescibacteria group bacterium]